MAYSRQWKKFIYGVVYAENIVEHFMNRVYMGKAMVVNIDKLTVVKIYFKVQAQWKKILRL